MLCYPIQWSWTFPWWNHVFFFLIINLVRFLKSLNRCFKTSSSGGRHTFLYNLSRCQIKCSILLSTHDLCFLITGLSGAKWSSAAKMVVCNNSTSSFISIHSQFTECRFDSMWLLNFPKIGYFASFFKLRETIILPGGKRVVFRTWPKPWNDQWLYYDKHDSQWQDYPNRCGPSKLLNSLELLSLLKDFWVQDYWFS